LGECGEGRRAHGGFQRGQAHSSSSRKITSAANTSRANAKRVAAYHEARLAELIEHITAALDRYRTGEIDAYAIDETIHHYHRAARELWKFCWSGGGGTHIDLIAHLLDQMATDGETINWWEQVTPRQRE